MIGLNSQSPQERQAGWQCPRLGTWYEFRLVLSVTLLRVGGRKWSLSSGGRPSVLMAMKETAGSAMPRMQRLLLGSRGRGTLQARAVTKPLVKPGLSISSANSHCWNGALGAHLQLWDKILCQKFSPLDSIKPCEMLPGSSQQSMYPVFLSLMTLCSTMYLKEWCA